MSDVLVILAGGLGTRIGGPKTSLRFGGKPALEWLLDRLAWPGPTVLSVGPRNASPSGVERFDRVIVDGEEGLGPLAGVRGALAGSGERFAFVPVDQPLVTRAAIDEQLSLARASGRGQMGARVTGPRAIEPFPFVLPAGARDGVEELWASGGRSLRSLLAAGLCDLFDASDWPASIWLNVNCADDLAAVEEALRGQ